MHSQGLKCRRAWTKSRLFTFSTANLKPGLNLCLRLVDPDKRAAIVLIIVQPVPRGTGTMEFKKQRGCYHSERTIYKNTTPHIVGFSLGKAMNNSNLHNIQY
ncbi:hypothetical protein ACKVV1_006650 [Pyricularia oryzae]